MRPSEPDIRQLAITLVERLVRSGCIAVKGGRSSLDRRIANLLVADFQEEEEIDRQARAMADQIERTHSRETADMSKPKIIALVKRRLAKERGFIL